MNPTVYYSNTVILRFLGVSMYLVTAPTNLNTAVGRRIEAGSLIYVELVPRSSNPLMS